MQILLHLHISHTQPFSNTHIRLFLYVPFDVPTYNNFASSVIRDEMTPKHVRTPVSGRLVTSFPVLFP